MRALAAGALAASLLAGPAPRVWGGAATSALAAGGTASSAPGPARAAPDPGTPAQRAELFDTILARTLRREAFSEPKNRALGIDVEREMLRWRDEVVAADTDAKLLRALVKVSNARRDPHLRVELVEGGILPADTVGLAGDNYPDPDSRTPHAPIRLLPDYGEPGRYGLFVSDVAEGLDTLSGGTSVRVGHEVVAVNGRTLYQYLTEVEPYHRYATANGLWWQVARLLPQRSALFPAGLHGDGDLLLTLEPPGGAPYDVALPYLDPASLRWSRPEEPRYPEFAPIFETPTFAVHRHETKPVVLLSWHGFGEHLVRDVDRLVEWAREEGRLDHAVILDATRSRGGSLGAYALQRLTSRPFRVTFGNLRISDITREFVEGRLEEAARAAGPGPGAPGDPAWLAEWLRTDVLDSVRAGAAWSGTAPFKLAHLPPGSDGFLEPAEVHFQGALVVLLGPYGGSHLDQFASMMADNGLGQLVGMPAHGYSNTWEWDEVLELPGTDRPVVRFMWSIGHTIRPNGEVLEGNPAQVDDFLPLTRESWPDYPRMLLARALLYIEGP